MSTVWVAQTAFRYLSSEADRVYPLETGGVLVGYVANNGDLVVVQAIGPGPAAIHEPAYFLPDHCWQCCEIDSAFATSQGMHTYVGDWHTHPNGSPRMSSLDRRTLAAIAQHPEARIEKPIMLIGGGDCQKRKWLGHQYDSTRFLGILAPFKNCVVRIF